MGLNYSYDKGQTPLEDDESEGLIVRTINTREELDQIEQLHIERTIVWLVHRNISKDRILTENFIKFLHKKMFGEVWSWAGTFRTTDKNLGIDWTQIGIELKILLDDTNYWIENQVYAGLL